MEELDLIQIARNVLISTDPQRIIYECKSYKNIKEEFQQNRNDLAISREAKQIIDEQWELFHNHRNFNGPVCGIERVRKFSGPRWKFDFIEIDYKQYLATDACMRGIDKYCPALAVGVHALLLQGDAIIAIKFADGTLGTAGGAVEPSDFRSNDLAILNSIKREIKEEVGIPTEGLEIEMGGVFIVPNPVHLVFLFIARLPDSLEIQSPEGKEMHYEPIVAFEKIQLCDIGKFYNLFDSALLLCLRSAKLVD